MDRLWAPWRVGYILSAGEGDGVCIFCQFPSEGAAKYREHGILTVTERAFVILNKYPYNNGHLMVVPRAHAVDPCALGVEDRRALEELLTATVAAVRAALAPHGMNVGMNLGRVAGAGIDQHCHWHVVPRWNGDTNFMPVVGDVKVLSEGLAQSYERLLPHFTGLGEGPTS